VTAISQADTTIGASASVTVTAPATPAAVMVVTPSSVTLAAGGQQTFAATVSGNPIAVNWTINCASTVPDACGTISAAGLYTAPPSPPPGGSVSITATAKDNSVAPSGAFVTVQFSNASLNGQYAFTFTGQNAGAQYLAAGSITFDGNGNITGGTEDINSGVVSTVTINAGGTYHIGTDGRGNAMLQTSAGTANWQFTVINHAHAFVIRFDSGAAGASGTMDLQDASQFTSAGFTGNYAFNLSGSNAGGRPGSLAAAGALTSNGAGVISSGALEVNSAGVPPPGLSLNPGTYTAPSSAGRGTLAISSAFGAQTFAYYIVDANHVKVVETDATNHLAGDLFKQPAGQFTSAAIRGGFAFAFLGSTANGPLGEGGVLTFNGAGNVTSGTMDINSNGTVVQNGSAVTGTYTVTDAVTGRTTVSLTVGGSTLQYALYPQINGAMSVVEIDTTNTVAGRALPQSGSFSGGTLSGNYALNLTGTEFIPNNGEEDVVGQVVPNGGSAIAGAVAINDSGGTVSAAALSGSYQVSSSGRGLATLNTSSSAFPTGAFTFYIADSSDVFFLELDGNRVLAGIIQKQF
jgi:hypothetical protein